MCVLVHGLASQRLTPYPRHVFYIHLLLLWLQQSKENFQDQLLDSRINDLGFKLKKWP